MPATWKWFAFASFVLLATMAGAATNVNVAVSNGGLGIEVGKYDYLPYSNTYPQDLSFDAVLNPYGSWVTDSRLGRVWHPYVAAGWRPYTHGHWVMTSHGPTWVGYEPWAWAGYHYGSWVFTPGYGWVWVKGYQWHPGRVVWSTGSGVIGWMPQPDPRYDYQTVFGTNYSNVNNGLWVFVPATHFGQDNYSSFAYRPDAVRDFFRLKKVNVLRAAATRAELEQMTRHPIKVVAFKERDLQLDHQKVKVLVADNEDADVRKNKTRVIDEVIRPGLKDKDKGDHQQPQIDAKDLQKDQGKHEEKAAASKGGKDEGQGHNEKATAEKAGTKEVKDQKIDNAKKQTPRKAELKAKAKKKAKNQPKHKPTP